MSEDAEDKLHPWPAYYDRTSARSARPLLLEALGRFKTSGYAIDLGCGAGLETLELIQQGWRVLAVDSEPTSGERVRALVQPQDRDRLETLSVTFEEMELPPAELIWSGYSLSFCPPAHFDEVWAKILGALKPGGRIACDIFGVRHAWSSNADMTFLTANQARESLEGLEVESFVEQDEEGMTAFQGLQHWHAFKIIARKA